MGKKYSACGPAEPPPGMILAALDRVLDSDRLKISERNRRFLSFVVNRTIEGDAERIKAYAIGVDVFGRDETFDPALDPIVRIEATRLRAALATYYEGPGSEDVLKISIPAGSYVPVFSWTLPDTTVSGGIAGEPCVAVSPPPLSLVLCDNTPQEDVESRARAGLLLDSLIVRLRKLQFRILVAPPVERIAALKAIRQIFARPGGAACLDVAVRLMDGCRRYSWRLVNLDTGEVLASDTRDHPVASSAGDGVDGMANAIAIEVFETLRSSGQGTAATRQ